MNRGVALRIPRLAWWQWLLAALLAVGAAAVGWLVLKHVDWSQLLAELKSRPLLFFAAFAVLPAFGAPISVFYVGAGAATAGENPAFPLSIAILGSMASMSANITLSYLLARWVVRPPIERLARRLGYTIPQVHSDDVWVITLLLRITPGPPFFMQHYLLALGRVPMGVYLLVSIPACGLMGAAVVSAAAGLTSGSIVNVIAGVFFVTAIVMGVRFARKALQRRAKIRVGEKGEILPQAEDVSQSG